MIVNLDSNILSPELLLDTVKMALADSPLSQWVLNAENDNTVKPYQYYNALVGTTFGETEYNNLTSTTEGIKFLLYHIPGGYKVTNSKRLSALDVAQHIGDPVFNELSKYDVTQNGIIDDNDIAYVNAFDSVPEGYEKDDFISEIEQHRGKTTFTENAMYDIEGGDSGDGDGDIDENDVSALYESTFSYIESHPEKKPREPKEENSDDDGQE